MKNFKELINELSKDTYDRYNDKASDDVVKRYKSGDMDSRKVQNREKGIAHSAFKSSESERKDPTGQKSRAMRHKNQQDIANRGVK